MPIHYAIAAQVMDIQQDVPKHKDTFLVDSNVWYWMTYTNASTGGALPYQITHYPNYVNAALAADAKVYRTGLSFAELTHLIEKTEREIYSRSIPTKEYRHNLPAERKKVVSEVQVAWGQVKSLATPVEIAIDEPTTDAALYRLQNQRIDGYDVFILELMSKQNIQQIITDDGDFATIPGIQVFTANRSVLRAAQAQRRLVTR